MTLAYSIDKLLNDQTVLPYFIHFLDSCGKIELIQFWMHLQSFHSSFDSVNNSTSEDSTRDANAIFKSFFEEESPKYIHFPPEVVAAVKHNLSLPSKDSFKEAQSFVYNFFESEEFPEFKNSPFFKKHELEVLQGGCSLSDVIHIDRLLPVLLEMLSSGEEHQQLQFIISCDTFEDEYLRSSAEQATDDAMVIYDRYISMQASTPLPNVSSSDRLAVESSICTPSGEPDRNTFLSLRNRFCETLAKKYLVQLQKSPIFELYREELRSRLREIPSGTQTPRSQPDEEAFSFGGIGEREPLRITESPRSTVSLAQIDSLGRYKSMFDDTVWKKHDKPKLKSKLTSYLHRRAAKEEEEANEAAMAIIQDVQRMVSQRSFE